MQAKNGKYTTHFSAVPLLSGAFVGLATVVWSEANATVRQTCEFADQFATAAEAEKFARDRTQPPRLMAQR